MEQPLPWYIAGPLLGVTAPLMVLLVGREVGVSASFRHLCTALLPKAKGKIPGYSYDWKKHGGWLLVFTAGLVLGGLFSYLFTGGVGVPLLDSAYNDAAGYAVLGAGGLLVGFGTRWAGGCTSGHTIAGLSRLQPASLIASVSFFAGGTAASLVHRFLLGGGVP